MAARPIDAAEGYRIYRAYGGAIELDEINEALRGMGLRPVSPRMYLHYRRMAQHGYETYVPINRFRHRGRIRPRVVRGPASKVSRDMTTGRRRDHMDGRK